MSIEWAMWFALGFLAAGLLALLVMGAVWRRAVRLTTRRIAARVPTGVDDVLAEKDLLRAQHARDQRRLELAMADLRRRHADERLLVGRGRIEIDEARRALEAEALARGQSEAREAASTATLADRDARIVGLEAELAAATELGAGLRATLAERDAGMARLVEDHDRAVGDTVTAHDATVADFERQIEQARVEAATRRATLAALEAQIQGLRLQLGETGARLDASERARGLADAATAGERDRADRLDRRIERLVADVAAREDMADRRGRELERAREALMFSNARVASLTEGGGPMSPHAGDNLLRSMAQLESRNRELEDRLAGLGEAGSGETGPRGAASAPAEAGSADATTRSALRDRLADLAAEIVHLTRIAEGAASPIDRIVAVADAGPGEGPSLAARIRDLRRRAAEGAVPEARALVDATGGRDHAGSDRS